MAQHLSWSERNVIIDIVRGIAVVLMILAHAIYFFHTGVNPILSITALGANAVVFTTFLFVSGIASYLAYLSKQMDENLARKIVTRSFILYVLYLVVGWTSVITTKDALTIVAVLGQLVEVAVFWRVPSFSEFLLPYIFYPFVFILLRGFISAVLRSTVWTITLGIIVYSVGQVLFFVPVAEFLIPYKAILAGHEGRLLFPLLAYFPVYLLGLWLGSRFFSIQGARGESVLMQVLLICGVGALSLSLFSLFVPIVIFNPLTRWPPSPAFLSLGVFTGMFFLYSAQIMLPMRRLLPVWRFFGYAGVDSFDLFVSHIIFLHLYRRLWGVSYDDPLTVLVYFFVLLFISVLFSSLNWERSASIFHLGNISLSYQKHRTVKKRYLLTIAGLFFVIYIPVFIYPQSSVGGMATVGSAFEQTDVKVTDVGKWYVRTAETPLEFRAAIVGQNTSVDTQYTYEIRELGRNGVLRKAADDPPVYTASLDGVLAGKYTLIIRKARSVSLLPVYETVIYVSEPLYVSWTFDWEGWDVADKALSEIDELSSYAGEAAFTHFFNPRIYLSSVVEASRAKALTNWLKKRVETHGDEVAMHMHMHFDMVSQSGVTPRKAPAWGYRSDEGYDVHTTSYLLDEHIAMLRWGIYQFENNGLPRPLGYRAGGWFADIELLTALSAEGFIYDASGREQPTEGPFRSIPWRLSQGAQPYFPALSDINSAGDPSLAILEIPNNGLDTYAYDEEAMLARFRMHLKDEVLREKRMVSFMSHPNWYTKEFPKARRVIGQIRNHLFKNDAGPVIFVKQEDIYRLWRQ